MRLTPATQDTKRLARAALEGLQAIFRPSVKYAKAGVMLFDLQDERIEQLALFGEESAAADARRDPGGTGLMQTVDALNSRFGRGTVRLAGAGIAQAWQNKQERLTPGYTTQWDQVPIVRA